MPTPNPKYSLSIRLVQPQDWPAVRKATLQMLADAPHAFGEPLVEAEARTTQEWQQWAKQLANPLQGCAYLAEDSQGACGFVRVDTTLPQFPPGAALAAQLWVAPRQRGTGLGRKLMDAATRWAEERGAEEMFLGVLETNPSTVKFYEHLGYGDTELRDQSSGDASKQIIVMARRLKP